MKDLSWDVIGGSSIKGGSTYGDTVTWDLQG